MQEYPVCLRPSQHVLVGVSSAYHRQCHDTPFPSPNTGHYNSSQIGKLSLNNAQCNQINAPRSEMRVSRLKVQNGSSWAYDKLHNDNELTALSSYGFKVGRLQGSTEVLLESAVCKMNAVWNRQVFKTKAPCPFGTSRNQTPATRRHISKQNNPQLKFCCFGILL
jgi:hypothetical protein